MILHESAENYLKTILILQKRLGKVRSIDVANELGFSKPSVSIAVKKLRKEGLVDVEGSGDLLLTESGLNCASSVLERHAVIEGYLLNILDVDAKTAHMDSCRLEHLLSEETFNKIKENVKETLPNQKEGTDDK